jgi:glutaminyl-tRNA synthetase
MSEENQPPLPAMKASKSATVKMHKKAANAAKKKPDLDGIALLELGVKAMDLKEYDKALPLFEEAYKTCMESTKVEMVKREKTEGGGEKNVNTTKKNTKETTTEKEQHQKDACEEAVKLILNKPGELLAKKKEIDAKLPNYAKNSEENMKRHMENTGGKYRTRFPPEPNGYLHIGHAKAMYFDFGVARLNKGETYLRFDDTNPTAEKQEYIDSIKDSCKWLGHEPTKITYSSDYFDRLYELAIQLIKSGGAYVCHQTKTETARSRSLLREFQEKCAKSGVENRYEVELPEGAASPYRERSVEENLELFEKMRSGQCEEGECSLRMKGDLRSDITSMWDIAAYRVKKAEHPRTGSKWCIYPTYDYTHNIVDSLENITHSLCTLEFETRQAPNGPYYWLLDKLNVYKPSTWEFSRCNITYNVMSKRKLNLLVTQGLVNGWDDPRMLTINGMRRRGYTPTSVNSFCAKMGVTRNENVQPLERLENEIRAELSVDSNRFFAVLDPLKVEIVNYPKDRAAELLMDAPFHPSFMEERGMRKIQLTETVFIDRNDFREVDDPSFFGLSVNKKVRLLFAYDITCTGITKNPVTGVIESVQCEIDMDSRANKPPKGKLHWANTEFKTAEVRVYDKLFAVPVPGKVVEEGEGGEVVPEATALVAADEEEEEEEEDANEDAAKQKSLKELELEHPWLKQLNPDSLVVYKNALVEPMLIENHADQPYSARVELQRLGFFTFDFDSTKAKPVLNRIVTLKESNTKKK